MVDSLSVLWTVSGHEHFQTQMETWIASWMDGDATADWLHKKYTGEVEKGGGQGKTGNISQHRLEEAH